LSISSRTKATITSYSEQGDQIFAHCFTHCCTLGSFIYCLSRPNFGFFQGKSDAVILTRNGMGLKMGLHLGDFFHNHIWSPWQVNQGQAFRYLRREPLEQGGREKRKRKLNFVSIPILKKKIFKNLKQFFCSETMKKKYHIIRIIYN
jgi:hypothetical protein